MVLFMLSGAISSSPQAATVSKNRFSELKLLKVNPMPVLAERKDNFVTPATLSAQLRANASIVLDLNSGAILFDKNKDQQKYPASTTKLMTVLVAMDYYDLNQVVTVGPALMNQGQVIGLQIGEKITVKDLIAAVLINSGNDAAYTLADNYAGGFDNFIKAMNEKAAVLHLESTHFVNPAGLDQVGQVTTARDLVLLAKECLAVPIIRELVNTKQMQITDLTGKKAYTLINTNELLGTRLHVHGIKTGTTELARQVLVTLWTKEGHKVLIVVMDSDDRYTDTNLIVDWLENQVEWVNID